MDYEKQFRKLIINALDQNASDIHMQITDTNSRCEFRTLKGLNQFNLVKINHEFFEYIKYISNIDLLTGLKPQSGRIKIRINHKEYYIRCAYFKNYLIETLVLRILNPKFTLTIDSLFGSHAKMIRTQLERKSGLVLFCGSTGSGKTTSMFTCLKELNTLKIYTIEDPIEFYYENLVQLEVNLNHSFNFKDAIKQVLRHDPNIIVIGEIRDEIEANAAIRCALSGHLVISTIHSNSTIMTLERLKDMGIEMNLLNQLINLIIYQEIVIDEVNNVRKAEFTFYKN
jgi:type II secretory ATPase GspE/PulE/Tfp pilus assembly ATPase PilB-like protein